MGVACSDAQPATDLALVDHRPDGSIREVTFGQLSELSNRFANGLKGLGIEPGDRVGIVVPQSLETGVAHLGTYKAGAVAMPLSVLFGPEALRFRLQDSGAKVVVTAPESLEQVIEACTDLDTRIVVAGDSGAYPSFDRVVGSGRATVDPPGSGPDTPALLIYTSGTTGSPKGALHGHRVLLGHMPGFELMFDFFGRAGDRIWTPADWAWIGGLLDVVLPGWLRGRPVLAAPREGFDPQWAVDLMVEHGITTAFLPPTSLKLMRRAGVDASRLELRSCMSGGEPLGTEMLQWAEAELGVVINEIYGQTEANIVVGNSRTVWEVRPGSMGRPFPGHDVAVITPDGRPSPVGEIGEIAVRSPDPVMFLGYWNNPGATAEKFAGEWLRTGDLGVTDEDGYLWFRARADDLINSAGYRIGPGEIEDCLLKHAAVAMVAVVGVPDELRGEAVKAYVQLAPGAAPSDALVAELQALVRTRLSAHEYPRHVEFVESLPMTTTGKVRRRELRERHQDPGLTPGRT
ncbi:MAG: AMP-binding protein [Actinobacteria bacterium]|nr:AMP-binding protein [Actinomycetota bacterium]